MNITDCCSLGADYNQLSSIAVNRLQGELAKDGRDPAAAASLKVPQKAPAGAAGRSAFSKSLGKKKGRDLAVSSAYNHVCCTM
jgi:ATP-dependent Clp protease ATP-binding subunit ClpC